MSSLLKSLFPRLQRGKEGQGCSWCDRAAGTEQGARDLHERLNFALLLSASDSAATPASPIWLLYRLQRGGEGQRCSWRDRAAGAEQGARDLLECRQQAQCTRKLATVPPAFELFNHNCFGVHLRLSRRPFPNRRSLDHARPPPAQRRALLYGLGRPGPPRCVLSSRLRGCCGDRELAQQ
jgi:hypothetical protein